MLGAAGAGAGAGFGFGVGIAATGCGSATGAGAGAWACGAGAWGAGATAASCCCAWCWLRRCGLGRRRGRRHHGAIRANHEGLDAARPAVGIIDGGHGGRRGDGTRARHRRHGQLLLAGDDALSLGLISILKTLIDQLVLVRKFLATGILRRFLDGARIGLHHGGLAAAHGATALLIGKGERAAQGHGAKQGAADHEHAAASQAKLAPGFRLNALHARLELAVIEEVRIGLLALVETLGRAGG